MREQFQNLPDIDAKHNEVHRKAYQTPYLLREVTSYPVADEMELREEVIYINSSVSAIRCIKISNTKVVSASLT